MTTKEILISFLNHYIDREFQYHDLEKSIVQFGLNYHNKLHNIQTYTRGFRLLKNDKKELEKNGIEIIKIPSSSIADKWKVIRVGGINVNRNS
jgi:hypothetical protein